MILLNFAHPITAEQRQTIEVLINQPVERIIDIQVQVDTQQPLTPQVITLADQASLTVTEWQTEPLLVNPPSLNFVAAALLAELHGRSGYFVPIVRIRPVADSLPPRFEVAEIINLQAVRDEARGQRKEIDRETAVNAD